jgi:hypothetical protein
MNDEINDKFEERLKWGPVYAMYEAYLRDGYIVYLSDCGKYIINHWHNGKIETEELYDTENEMG